MLTWIKWRAAIALLCIISMVSCGRKDEGSSPEVKMPKVEKTALKALSADGRKVLALIDEGRLDAIDDALRGLEHSDPDEALVLRACADLSRDCCYKFNPSAAEFSKTLEEMRGMPHFNMLKQQVGIMRQQVGVVDPVSDFEAAAASDRKWKTLWPDLAFGRMVRKLRALAAEGESLTPFPAGAFFSPDKRYIANGILEGISELDGAVLLDSPLKPKPEPGMATLMAKIHSPSYMQDLAMERWGEELVEERESYKHFFLPGVWFEVVGAVAARDSGVWKEWRKGFVDVAECYARRGCFLLP